MNYDGSISWCSDLALNVTLQRWQSLTNSLPYPCSSQLLDCLLGDLLGISRIALRKRRKQDFSCPVSCCQFCCKVSPSVVETFILLCIENTQAVKKVQGLGFR